VTHCVVDASVALSWSFEDERTPYARRVLETLRRDGAVAPAIWPLEVTNAMLSAMRKGRIEQRSATRILAYLLALGIAHRLSAYDASYLELALRRGLPLATEDRRLATAAIAAGVEIL
jgi:predicted nucleic acid-binding protein